MKYPQQILLALLVLISFNLQAQIDHNKVAEFARKYAETHDRSLGEINVILNNAIYQQSIIDKMERPAEGTLTWEKYRNLFLREERIAEGVLFWEEHEQVLNEVSQESGVPIDIILGVIGVETFFGKRIGEFRVLDALYTLAFGYPKRSSYFTSELEKFLEMTSQEKLDIYEMKGSYAGAIGYGQFMPSSYMAYAKSYDKNGSRDLMQPDDAIASVANYLKVHRWEEGGPVASKVSNLINPEDINTSGTKPRLTLSYYSNKGYIPSGNVSPYRKAALLDFEFEDGHKEYWFGYQNFYVITRYNHSRLYALAVYQLGQAIKDRRMKP